MKRIFAAVTAALAALVIAAPASAHTAVATITCTDGTLTVTFTYTQFPPDTSTTSQQTVDVNGTQVYNEPFDFSGAEDTSEVVLSPFSGIATVTAAWDFTSSDGFQKEGSTTEEVDCGTPPPPSTTGGNTTGGTTGTGGTGGTGGTSGTGGTTGTGGVIGSTTGGSGNTAGELPFTGLPIWIPMLLAVVLLASGGFLLRRKRDDVS
jgi:hypothetical protein